MFTQDQNSHGRRVAQAQRFERMVRHHEQALFRYALHQLGCDADARDCAQEALIAAWRAGAAERDPDAPARGWLLRICQRKVIDLVRRRRREHAVLGLEVDAALVGDAGDAVAAFAERSRALDALDGLRPEFRAVAVLRLVHDLSEAETAARLGLPLNTVKSRLHRARRELAAALGDGDSSSELESCVAATS